MGLSLRSAQTMIEAGLAAANAQGIQVSIVVVDGAGNLIAAARMDGALLPSPDIALGKAVAAALFRRSTTEMAQMWPPGAPVPAAMSVRTGGRFIPHQGGLPIREGEVVVGAVGVSGAKATQDEEVAQAAIETLGART